VPSLTDVSVHWPTLDELARALTLRAGYNPTVVTLGTTLLGLAAGTVGVFAMLRKRALMADALSHATLPGVCLAFLLATLLGLEARSLALLLIGAALTGILGVLTVQALLRHTRLTEDTSIGLVLSLFFAVGVVLLSLIQNLEAGNQGGLKAFIYGQTAAMLARDALLMAALALAAAAITALFFKELALVCFDDAFAEVGGWPVTRIDLVMMALVVLITVAGLQAVGLILVVALLIIPPAAARFWSDRLRTIALLAAFIGALSGYLGAVASILLPRMPAGAVIVLTAGFVFLASLLAAPRRGAIAASLRRIATAFRVRRDHLLRALAEHPAGITTAALAAQGLGRRASLAPILAHLRRRGLATRRDDTWSLTDTGRDAGRRLLHVHRLWEEYLVRYAHVASTHVDWSADTLEHILSPALIAELESALNASTTRPHS
jgi:manganese/zinc/iron transport system permease protein